MRKPHYWKEAGRTTAPSEMIILDVETWHAEKAKVEGGELQTFRLACAVAYRYERGRRTRMSRLQTTDVSEVWQFILSRLQDERVVWLWCHNAPFDIGASNLWQYITYPRYAVGKCVLTPSTTWIDGAWDGKRLVFCDTCNFFKCSLEEVGKAVGLPKMTMPSQDEDDDTWFDYCMNDVLVTAKAVDQLIDFVRAEELGRWQPTVAGMAFQAYRTRFMDHKVLVHCDIDVLDMERESYYGGIVETAYVGRTTIGPIYELDVVSMYPWVCRQTLPTKFKFSSDTAGVDRIRELTKRFMCIADVEIRSDTDVYPVRLKNRTYHARGRFRTSLAHPELMQAIERGHVKYVHFAAFYEHAPIFKRFMEWGFERRLHYKDLSQDGFAVMCKYLINGLYGKTGQRSPRWIEWGPDAFRIIESEHGLNEGALGILDDWPPSSDSHEWSCLVPEYDITLNLRNYWGVIEVDCGYSESRDSCPAIAACVTSYARTLLRGFQNIAGERNWTYSDTDSIWCNAEGYRRLSESGNVGVKEWGRLELKAVHDWMHIHGPKDYEIPGCVKLKGIKKNWIPGQNKPYSMLQFPSAMNQIKHPEPRGVFVRRVEKELKRVIDRCTVGPDGWTEPFTLGVNNGNA